MLDKNIEKYIMHEYGISSEDGYKITRLGGGKSGAKVYILELLTPRRSRDVGTYVLKLVDTNETWYDTKNNEADKSQKIYDEAESFRSHLVKVTKNHIVENTLVIVLTFATGSSLKVVSMDRISIDYKLELMERISYDLLEEFNRNKITPVTECNMLDSLCSYRLEESGNFNRRLRTFLRNPERPAMRINGAVYPNPKYYISELKKIVSSKIHSYLMGVVHGDLHQKNILTKNQAKDYAVIDYDSCSYNYLFFDQAYLELNSYSLVFKDWDIDKWMEAVEFAWRVEDAENESVEFSVIVNIEKRIRNGIKRWQEKEMSNNADNVWMQFQLARIAAGINFFSKSGIEDEVELTKYLIYIGSGLRTLFSMLDYNWNNQEASELKNGEKDHQEAEKLWDECGKFRNEFIKILITDDSYSEERYKEVRDISNIEWRLIADIGSKQISCDLVSKLLKNLKNSPKEVNYENSSITLASTGILRNKMGNKETPFEQRKRFIKNIKAIIKKICSAEPKKALIFVMDVHGENNICKILCGTLLEDGLIPAGSRFVYLDGNFDTSLTPEDLEQQKIIFYKHNSLDLSIMAQTVRMYGLSGKKTEGEFYLPCLESCDGTIQKKDWDDYNAYVELLYVGMENSLRDFSDGSDFYKGNEISWSDIRWNHDVKFEKYGEWKDRISEKLENGRNEECSLAHAAGAGGTTLSKRLMWDFKDLYPTMRIRKYDENVADVLISIYRKTGKCLLVVVEMGSSVVSEEELEIIKKKIDGSSCRAVFLKVERAESKNGKDIFLEAELKENKDAENFYAEYCEKTEDPVRINNLQKITFDNTSDEWRGQRCAFFYGFYTYQEEYEGLGHFLNSTIIEASDIVKNILADLALVTRYSQNICMPVHEMGYRINLESGTIPMIFHTLGSGIEKILVLREGGFRICHPLIAEKLLEMLDISHNYYPECLYASALRFIDNIHNIYIEADRDYVDQIFKELFIDRSYIDGEQQKFAQLINDLEKQTYKVNVFEKLISYYPDNPHYYNHLGRLEIAVEQNLQFDKAISHLNKALKICEENELDTTSHLTTLGCIYSRKVKDDLASRNRSIERLLESMETDYSLAFSCFEKARLEREDSSYAYFPNILMICNVVRYISKSTRQNLSTLLKNEKFEKWYNYHSGIAIQLYDEMKRKSGETLSEEIRQNAEENILYMKDNAAGMKQKLAWAKKNVGLRECCNLRRSVAMMIFMDNNFRWEGVNKEELEFAEKEMEQILIEGEFRQNDVISWFNIYRQMDDFDTGRAKRYIQDYMEESYYKNYLLWILSFKDYCDGLISYKQVEGYLNACKNNGKLVDDNIRTSRYLDVFTNDQNCFPIQKFSNRPDEQGNYQNMKSFEGQIVKIDGTVKGEILLDSNDEIRIFFTPSFTVDDVKHEFTRSDYYSKVKFNLVFTYSGYRAWNPEKI